MATCGKCQRRKVVDYHVEPAEARKTVVLNRWPMGKLCASCLAHLVAKFLDLFRDAFEALQVPVPSRPQSD